MMKAWNASPPHKFEQFCYADYYMAGAGDEITAGHLCETDLALYDTDDSDEG